jgi:hypothetical protein
MATIEIGVPAGIRIAMDTAPAVGKNDIADRKDIRYPPTDFGLQLYRQ